MTSPLPLMMLAGAGSDEWHHFEAGVVERSPDGSPRRGSMGVSYGIDVDLCARYIELERNDAAFLAEVQTLRHVRHGTYTRPLSARLCLHIIKWLVSDDTQFVIRRGWRTLWVARRTSGLIVDATHRYALRFSYVVEGPATEAIQRRADAKMGHIPYAVIWI